MDKKVVEVKSGDGTLIAIVIRKDFNPEGINFISKEDFPLQVGVSGYKKGSRIKPHVHLEKEIRINKVQEVIYVKKGSLRVDFYDLDADKFSSTTLSIGDTILFVDGGHGFEVLEDTEIIEVKQGPYSGKKDDKRFLE